MRSVSVGFWAAIGGRHESAASSGISHFIEHLLFKGTSKRTAKQITEQVEGIGGYLNAFTTEDHTCYYAKAAAPHFGRLCDVLGDMYLHSVFAAAGDRAGARGHPRGDPHVSGHPGAARAGAAHANDVAGPSARAPAHRHRGDDQLA